MPFDRSRSAACYSQSLHEYVTQMVSIPAGVLVAQVNDASLNPLLYSCAEMQSVKVQRLLP